MEELELAIKFAPKKLTSSNVSYLEWLALYYNDLPQEEIKLWHLINRYKHLASPRLLSLQQAIYQKALKQGVKMFEGEIKKIPIAPESSEGPTAS